MKTFYKVMYIIHVTSIHLLDLQSLLDQNGMKNKQFR